MAQSEHHYKAGAAMPVISVTRLRVRALKYMPGFYWYAIQSQFQAKRASGCLHAITLRDAHRTFWTITAWTDEASLKAFMLSGPHRKVMPKLRSWCDEASVARWTQDSADLPDWTEAHRRLATHGRPSKVDHPSVAQLSAFASPASDNAVLVRT
jgi:hypothetical protein